MNESFVDKHDDGIYADKVLDDIDDGTPGWDNQESPWKYMGAGIVKVTDEDFYLEFGATVPFAQLFGLNTAIVDESIVVKPKLELLTTPNPEKPTAPVEPKRPELKEPTQPVEPKVPTPPTEPVKPPKEEKPTEPVKPPKEEKSTESLELPKEEKSTEPVEPPKEEKPTLPRTGSASDMSMSVVGLLTTLASFFVFTKRKYESNK